MEMAAQRLTRFGKDAMTRQVESKEADQNSGHAARLRLQSSGVDMGRWVRLTLKKAVWMQTTILGSSTLQPLPLIHRGARPEREMPLIAPPQ